MILSREYLGNFSDFFLLDLMYGFSLESTAKITGPKGEADWTLLEWFLCLSWAKYDLTLFKSFLINIKKCYLQKNIKMLLIWDGDNFYHNFQPNSMEQRAFIEFVRLCYLFDVVIHCASDNNETFANLALIKADDILQINNGFSKEQTKEFLNEFVTVPKLGFLLTEAEHNEIYEMTKGNCFLLKKFIETAPNQRSFEQNYSLFLKNAHQECKEKVISFFEKQIQSNEKNWIDNFYLLLPYMDVDQTFPGELHKYLDRNNMFLDENGHNSEKSLKSVTGISRLQILQEYSSRMTKYDSITDGLKKRVREESNGSIKGSLFEKFVIHSINLKLKNGGSFQMDYDKLVGKGKNMHVCKKPENITFSFKDPKKSCKHYGGINDVLVEMRAKKNAIMVPTSSTNPHFDFLIIQYDESKDHYYIYVAQVSISISGHEESDVLFKKENESKKTLDSEFKNITWHFIWINGDYNYTAETFYNAKKNSDVKFDRESWIAPLREQLWSFG